MIFSNDLREALKHSAAVRSARKYALSQHYWRHGKKRAALARSSLRVWGEGKEVGMRD
jgi:hypothetical protein